MTANRPKKKNRQGRFFFVFFYDSSCAGWNTAAAVSVSTSSDAPLSTVKLYTSPGATSFQRMQPAPPSSQRSSAGHQRTVDCACNLPPLYPEMSGIVSDTS